MLQFLAQLLPLLQGAGSAIAGGIGSVGSGIASGAKTLRSMLPGLSGAEQAAVGAGTASALPLGYRLGGTMGAMGDLLGGKTLGNLMMNPGMKTLGAFGKEQLLPAILSGQTGQQRQQVGPGAMETKQRLSTEVPKIEDPILRRMYQNLNPGNQGQSFQPTQMKPWGPAPYPRKMSTV